MPDQLDFRLLHALHLDGREPLRRLAEVVGVSDQTVARRYQRLRDDHALRVVGRLDATRLGHPEWVVRLRCAAGTAVRLASTLARRPDTSWVRIASGGDEVLGNLCPHNDEARDELLLTPPPGVRSVVAHHLLHTFRGGPTTWARVTSALDENQSARLTARDRNPGPDKPVELTQTDRVLVAELAADGRRTNAALAIATGWHETTVRRRIAELRDAGALYFDVDYDAARLGYPWTTLIWITVDAARLAHVGEELSRYPEIPFVAAISGASNLLASVLSVDTASLYQLLSTRIGPTPGIRHIEITPVLRTVKRTGTDTPKVSSARR